MLRFFVGLGWRGGEGLGRGPAVGAASSVGGWCLEDGGAGACKESAKEIIPGKEGVSGMRGWRLGLLYSSSKILMKIRHLGGAVG